MEKQIRPLSVYKKINKNWYEFYKKASRDMFEGEKSPKENENNWYWMYALLCSEIPQAKDNKPNPFYYSHEGKGISNKCTVSEIGRLILTGWYYDIVNFTLEVSKNIYSGYCVKLEKGEKFNDLEFAKAIKHIREYVTYYYNNQQDLKVYLLKHFFEKELTKLLPELPEELKVYKRGVEFFKEIKDTQLKKDKDWYYKAYRKLESYSEYLTEILDNYGIEYFSEEQYEESQQQENEEYWKELEELETKYNEQCKNVILGSNILEHKKIKLLT